MLTTKDLENKQTTFKLYNGTGCWYDGYFDYQISMLNGRFALYSHSEVDGSTELLCNKIDNIEHLEFLYESLSGEVFE